MFGIIHVPLEQASQSQMKQNQIKPSQTQPNPTKFSAFCLALEGVSSSFLTIGNLQIPEPGF